MVEPKLLKHSLLGAVAIAIAVAIGIRGAGISTCSQNDTSIKASIRSDGGSSEDEAVGEGDWANKKESYPIAPDLGVDNNDHAMDPISGNNRGSGDHLGTPNSAKEP